MSAQYLLRRKPSPVRLDAIKHAYAVGQSVRLKSDFNAPSIFRIISRLPIERDGLQYRIRSDEERHERIASQESLEPIVDSGELAKRVFREVQQVKYVQK